MSDRHGVTVLLLNFRDAERSIACVRSAISEGAECVLVWDNSADAGCSAKTIRQHFPDNSRVWIQISDCNLGFAAGVNRAIECIREERPSDWVLVINNDATLRPGAVRKLASEMEASPAALMLVPAVSHAGNERRVMYYHRWSGLLLHFPHVGCFAFPSGCCFLIAPERYRGPLYDERFFMYGEDVELGTRFAVDSEIVFLAEVLVDHEGSASSRLGSRFYEERVVAAHFLLVSALTRNQLKKAALVLSRIPFLLARALLRSFRFRSLLPLKALYWGGAIALGKDSLRQAAAVARKQPEASRRLP